MVKIPTGNDLAKAIKALRLTTNEFSRIAGVESRTVYDLIAEKIEPKDATKEKIAVVLHMSCPTCGQYRPKRKRPR